MYKRYNVENLTPFTSETGRYYGSIGGKASGKSRIHKKILNTYLEKMINDSDLMQFKGRKRLSDSEYDLAKRLLHAQKIINNRLNKLMAYSNKKYGL